MYWALAVSCWLLTGVADPPPALDAQGATTTTRLPDLEAATTGIKKQALSTSCCISVAAPLRCARLQLCWAPLRSAKPFVVWDAIIDNTLSKDTGLRWES